MQPTITAGEALDYARLAQRAYDPAVAPEIRIGSTEIYLIRRPNGRVALVWCGSTDFSDWLTNLRFARHWWTARGCWVHGGYLADHRATVEAVTRLLERLGWPEWEALGHSRGGGQCLLMAADLAGLGHPPARIATFGAPRVGFGGLARRLAGIPHHRIVCGADVVPETPLAFAGWRHAVPPIRVGRPRNPLRDHLLETGPMSALSALPPAEILTATKPWITSKTMWGGIAAALVFAAQLAGIDLAPFAPILQVLGIEIDPATILSSLGLSGAALTVYGRLVAKAAIGGGIAATPTTMRLLPLAVVGLALAGTLPLGACSGTVMPGPLADITAASPLREVASARANLNAALAAAAVYVQSGQATGDLMDEVRDLSSGAAAAVQKADAMAQTRPAAWAAENREPTRDELLGLAKETESLLAIIRGE